MPSVNIDVSLPQRRHVTGCELAVSVTLTNTASTKELLLVQSLDSDVPFEYELVSAQHGTFQFSKRLYDRQAYEHGVVPPNPQLEPLIPGESRTFTDDVLNWMTVPIPAGNYELLVHWDAPNGERVTAPSLSLSLEALRAGHHVCGGDLGGQVLVSAMTHAEEPLVLFRRVSEYARPSLGHGVTVAQPSSLGGLSIGCELDDTSPWRWYTWLTEGHLNGVIHWGAEVTKTLAPTLCAVSKPRLMPLGWQTRRAAAVFAVLGEIGGQAAVDVILIPQVGEPQHCVYPLECAVPDLAAAGSYFPGLGVLELVFGFERAGRTRILAQRLDISLTDAPAPRQLLEVDGALRALSLAPRVHDDSSVDAIIGDAYYRVGLSAANAQHSPLHPLPAAASWRLAAVPHPSWPVLAQVGDTLMLARAKTDPTWRTVASSVHGLSHPEIVHLATTEGGEEGVLVGTYIDAQLGYSVVGLAVE